MKYKFPIVCAGTLVLLFALICICILYDEYLQSEEGGVWGYVMCALGVIGFLYSCKMFGE